MKTFNWGAFFKGIQKAADDYAANKPLPPSKPMTGAELAASAKQLQALLPTVIAWLDAHPGAITAADDILEALSGGGLTWAASVENAVNAVPGALAKAEQWLPVLITLLSGIHIEGGSPPSIPPGLGQSPYRSR